MAKPLIAMTIGKNHYCRMMSASAWSALEGFAEVIHHEGGEPATKEELLKLLPMADGLITSWGVACLDADVIKASPHLKAMAHMGSSVQRFVSRELWERGIQVTSTAPALAVDVAETALGLMIIGMKKVLQFGQLVRNGGWREDPAWPAREMFGKTVGIIGASNVGRHVMKLLANFRVDVLLYDPYVTKDAAAEFGAEKSGLDELLARADIISLHAPATKETFHLLDHTRLGLMKDDALLINTARGSLIDEEALITELANGRFFAFLDVTEPEPPAKHSPLRTLPNVVVIPHIAGCIENCGRMGEMAVEELRRFFSGMPPLFRISEEMLARIS
jgi:phosphoglycerate dehydrogenase-like enzyme